MIPALVGLNSRERRAMEKRLHEDNKQWPAELKEIPQSGWNSGAPKNVRRVFRSRDFLAQVYEDQGLMRLSVNRTRVGLDGRWSADISWDELQALKKQAGYGDMDAVEVFPRDSDAVNVANMRHLWLLPDGIPFRWKNK